MDVPSDRKPVPAELIKWVKALKDNIDGMYYAHTLVTPGTDEQAQKTLVLRSFQVGLMFGLKDPERGGLLYRAISALADAMVGTSESEASDESDEELLETLRKYDDLQMPEGMAEWVDQRVTEAMESGELEAGRPDDAPDADVHAICLDEGLVMHAHSEKGLIWLATKVRAGDSLVTGPVSGCSDHQQLAILPKYALDVLTLAIADSIVIDISCDQDTGFPTWAQEMVSELQGEVGH